MTKFLYSAVIILLFALVMISPCIQIALSASKKKFVWLIMPIVTFIIMGLVAFFADNWNIVIRILFALVVPVILLVFHIFVKKNLFH